MLVAVLLSFRNCYHISTKDQQPVQQGGSYYLVLAAAAAAALSAFEVPGFLDAEVKVPKRFVGLGAMMLAFGRDAADAALPVGLLS
jgi:hypothetical protein